MKGQTRPGIQKYQEFAHHVESIAGRAPPMPGIKGIGGGGTHDGAGPPRSEPAPQQANAPRMNFRRDKYYGRGPSGVESSYRHLEFVGGGSRSAARGA